MRQQGKEEAVVAGDLLALELRKKRAADAARRREAAAVGGSTELLQASIAERRAQVQARHLAQHFRCGIICRDPRCDSPTRNRRC